MTKRKYCGSCRDFLYEDVSGYGICAKDNDRHFCGSKCIYKNEEK